MKKITEQIIVSPNTATFKDLAEKWMHYGECVCPFCNETNVVAGPKVGSGLAFVFEGCGHHMGTAATEKMGEISVLFRGHEYEYYDDIETDYDASDRSAYDSEKIALARGER